MKLTSGSARAAFLALAVSFFGLLANGRAIGSGDTNAVEKTAAALSQHGSFVLENGEPLDPFTRPAVGGRVSIYPALPSILAAPLFWIFGLFFDLNPMGQQVAGKLSAAFISALVIAAMASTFARRVPAAFAVISALIFGLGTNVFATSQALWQHPAALLFLSLALASLDRMNSEAAPDRLRHATKAALFLSLAAACRPACIPICGVLIVYLLYQNRESKGWILIAALVPATGVAAYNEHFFGAPWRFGQTMSGRFFGAFPESLGGLFLSPARGLFLYTPVALIALWALLRASRGSVFARALLFAVIAHFLFIASWNEWHGGESFGPRLLVDMLPALFFFLPEGLAAWPRMGALLAAGSVAIQLIGAWTYDYRWERLHQRGQAFDAALWSWSESPMAFALREGVVIQGVPDVEGRRIRFQSRRFVPFGPRGSSISATSEGLRVEGDALLRDIRMERGARLSEGRVLLQHPADALAFRVMVGGEIGLRLIGTLQGTLVVETLGGSTSLPTDGEFDLTVPLTVSPADDIYLRSGAGELWLARIDAKAR